MKTRFSFRPARLVSAVLRKTALCGAATLLSSSAWADFNITLSGDPSTGLLTNAYPINPHPAPEDIVLHHTQVAGQFPQALFFLGWMENGSIVSTNDSPTVFVSGPRQFVAAFYTSNFVNGTAWTDGVIPFVFDSAVSAAHRKIFIEAMDHWAFDTRTHIAFVPWKGDVNTPGRSILQVTYAAPGGKSYTHYVGMPAAGSGNTVELQIAALDSVPPQSVDHELGHALGLHHAHQRQDRGPHIDIDWPNVPSDMVDQLAIVKDSDWLPGTNTEPYDILSVMHYLNGVGITAKASEPAAGIFNQPDYLPTIQLSDIKHVRNLYGTGGESRFVDNTTTGGTQDGSLSNPYRALNTAVTNNAFRHDTGSRLWLAPSTYAIGATRITGPQKILPYPGGGPARIVR